MTETKFFTVRLVRWSEHGHALRTVRESVFVQEQGVPPELELDEHDASAVHALAEDTEGRPIGAGRLLTDGHIGRLAVLPDWRGRRVGRTLLDALVAEAEHRGQAEAILNAQAHALEFYQHAGFKITSKAFVEAGILHREMRKRLQNG